MHVVIIGANKGIGLELVKQYKQMRYSVTAVCRNASAELSALDCHVIQDIDVTQDTSINKLQAQLGDTAIDILIHNSGILASDRFPNIDMHAMQRHFETNALGPLRTVLALSRNLLPGSKVGLVTSRVGSIEDNTSSNNYAYRTSKCAANMIGKCLSIDLQPKGVAVALLHPGYVRTNMTQHRGLIDTHESARGLVKIMNNLTLEGSGLFYHTNGEQLTW